VGSSLSWQTDTQLVEAVQRRLDAEPAVDCRDVAVKASDGVVALTGFVRSYRDKMAVEQAASHVRGVRGVANDLGVTGADERSDPEIAKDAVHTLRTHGITPHVIVTVRDGLVTLEGSVEEMRQRDAAEAAVRLVAGVKGVSNAISIG
jgi:osmotically-inducible protein OsmY